MFPQCSLIFKSFAHLPNAYVCAWFAAATTGTFQENDFPIPEGRKNRNLIKFLAGATAEGKTYQSVNSVEVGHSSCPDALMSHIIELCFLAQSYSPGVFLLISICPTFLN